MSATLHDRDFFAWTQQQSELLRAGKWSEIDVEHLVGAIESMGANERRELINRLAVLLAHLLKWEYQPNYRSRSWRLTIKEQRRQLERLLRDNPSLNARLSEFVTEAFVDAVLLSARETGLEENAFPTVCPYGVENIMNPDFFPGKD